MSAPTARPDFAGQLPELLLPLLPAAYRFAMCLTGTRIDANDLIQVATLAARRRFDQEAGDAPFKIWYYRIVVEAFAGRRAQSAPAAAAARSGRRRAGAESQLWEILDGMDQLPQELRVVTALYFVDRLSYAEIGSVLGLPADTVRARLHAGRAALRPGAARPDPSAPTTGR